MSNAPSFDIMTLLGANGFGTIGTDLFCLMWNPGTDKQTLVMDSEGFDTEQKDQYEQPGFQILVRGDKRESPKIVHDRARLIWLFIKDSSDSVTINSVEYLGFELSGNMVTLGKDENERFTYSMNFFTYRNPE